MPEWWSYSPQDFVMFSPRAYFRLLERHHQALWPMQIGAIALGLAIPALLRGHRDRLATIVLAACWAWVAWSFLYMRFATIRPLADISEAPARSRRCRRIPGRR
ncbi:MAG: hypothetical protein HQL40_08050 [Alphaproteobacteria bacterium]|nr:hypothetical protein [Alphaproteobacteria bacterium]